MTATLALTSLRRLPRREHAEMIPHEVVDERGLFIVDGTWGTIAPIELAPGVRTVGELEVVDHLDRGLPVIDTRPAAAYELETIPGARNVPWRETLEHIHDLPLEPTVYFCNGPQCAATPRAIEMMLDADHPAAAILYYRGGLHDWVTLGLPVEPGR